MSHETIINLSMLNYLSQTWPSSSRGYDSLVDLHRSQEQRCAKGGLAENPRYRKFSQPPMI